MTPSPSGSQNRIISSLVRSQLIDAEHLFTEIDLVHGRVLCDTEGVISDVYFPTSGVISAVVVMEDGGTIEGMLAGPEGAMGIGAAFGDSRSPWRLVVQASGSALTIPAATLGKLAMEIPELSTLLFRYSNALQQLATQSIACNRFHTITERMARWLLLMVDRTQTSEVLLTHEFLAQMLGTQRPAVTLALSTLEQAGLIHRAARAHVQIVDREGLEEASCECYRRSVREVEHVFSGS